MDFYVSMTVIKKMESKYEFLNTSLLLNTT